MDLVQRIKNTDWKVVGLGALLISGFYPVIKIGEIGTELFQGNPNLALDYYGLKGMTILAKGLVIASVTQYLYNAITGKFSKDHLNKINHYNTL